MIREYILLSDGLSEYQFYFVVCQPKLRLMESDYRRLQQSQDNAEPDVHTSTAGCFVCCAIPIAKQPHVQQYRVLDTPIVKGAFRDPEKFYSGNPWLNKFQLCFVLKVFWGKSLF
jgi:hypothetical protein